MAALEDQVQVTTWLAGELIEILVATSALLAGLIASPHCWKHLPSRVRCSTWDGAVSVTAKHASGQVGGDGSSVSTTLRMLDRYVKFVKSRRPRRSRLEWAAPASGTRSPCCACCSS